MNSSEYADTLRQIREVELAGGRALTEIELRLRLHAVADLARVLARKLANAEVLQ